MHVVQATRFRECSCSKFHVAYATHKALRHRTFHVTAEDHKVDPPQKPPQLCKLIERKLL